MENEWRREILKAWGIDNLPLDQQVIEVFEKVRDIPFGRMGSRDPWDVYRRNKGTCSGKNFLLKALYKNLGLETRDMICLQRWKDLTWFPDDTYRIVEFPDELLEMMGETEIVDFHNYLLVQRDGRWVRVDATVDLPLTKLGFYTTDEWDGMSDMPLCFVGTDKVWDCGDRGREKKANLTASLPEEIREARDLFLERMTTWIDELRERGEI
ncbi:MAG: hypothetical protein R6U57_06885 [Anaerolineales bacterium]